MRFVSTRDTGGRGSSFEEALFQGLAPDGGLYLPAEVKPLPEQDLGTLKGGPFQATANRLVSHLLGDALPAARIEKVVRDAFDFPIPLVELGPGEWVLELFHGPTFAFKDVGARFMARMMSALRPGEPNGLTVLVATSGDTGGAVADAYFGLPGIRVVVLYPKGQVSPIQEAQFTTLGGNVQAVPVLGSFDDCQRIAKEAFTDPDVQRRHQLTSANSINVGRLIPQALYYAHAWASLPPMSPSSPGLGAPVFAVPSGNLGNLVGGLLAQQMGIPVSRFVAATNANRPLPDYLETGVYEGRPSVATLSNAMDVGDPSNFERLRYLFDNDVSRVRTLVSASTWSDEETATCIRETHERTGRVLDPHTAVGLLGLRKEMGDRNTSDVATNAPFQTPAIVLGTAHPAKFREVVEPVIGTGLPLPKALAESLAAAESVNEVVEIPPELGALGDFLDRYSLSSL
ncbi:MAG: threonine synthase [Longimicrobiales bacterium]